MKEVLNLIEYLVYIFISIGLIFNCLGTIGLLRFPDVYTRLHAATKCTTFGSIFTSLAVIVYGFVLWYEGSTGYGILSLHSVVALVALVVTAATGAHALARGTHRHGIKPALAVVDKLEEERKVKE
ncbi:MAG: monovalent cation/H(+) antiporter subunit G [Candidatus Thermoplasmatota archaeon]|nr:monovalent cation/H(+) antiporter subunit G [Candidatus Thermoplasmatota archaeon]